MTVDAEDVELLSQTKWRLRIKGHAHYAIRSTKPATPMHRIILNAPAGIEVDHIDGDGLNNRRSNLRLATQQQNQRNRANKPAGCASRYLGVTRARKGWRARIRYSQTDRRNLGVFKTQREAAEAYKAAALARDAEFCGVARK